jgi:phosphatidylinositol-3,4,5-trisphosphate 3-phosphatase/dual-specificity protein phosphatase PTEN
MDFLRELVGGPKNRFKEGGFNLDLTYISPRIVAMAFPASGIEKLYRNSIDSIA